MLSNPLRYSGSAVKIHRAGFTFGWALLTSTFVQSFNSGLYTVQVLLLWWIGAYMRFWQLTFYQWVSQSFTGMHASWSAAWQVLSIAMPGHFESKHDVFPLIGSWLDHKNTIKGFGVIQPQNSLQRRPVLRQHTGRMCCSRFGSNSESIRVTNTQWNEVKRSFQCRT